MSSSGEVWRCAVELRFDYDGNGNPRPRGSRRVSFGAEFKDKRLFEIYLRRAQAAILNPHLSSDSFLSKTEQELKDFKDAKSLKFSKNIVCVDIRDPEATDLSFADLPGKSLQVQILYSAYLTATPLFRID